MRPWQGGCEGGAPDRGFQRCPRPQPTRLPLPPPHHPPADVRLLLAGKEPQPAECIAHPGRKVCKVDV